MSRFVIVGIIFGLSVIVFVQNLGASSMREIGFDIGGNIDEIAKGSGASGYSTQNIDGLLMYDANGLSSGGLVRYRRPGYEISFSPAYSLTLYADKKISNKSTVQTAALQALTRTINSHAAARAFVESVVGQFQAGRWERYIDDLCPAVTGRSSILDEIGQVENVNTCAFDPNYRLSDDEWIQLMESTQNYTWVGDGVLAKLTVSYNDFGRGVEYSIDLDFDDLGLLKQRAEANLSRELAEGDAKGWKSTEKHINYIEEAKKRVMILEGNAVRRGDNVVRRR